MKITLLEDVNNKPGKHKIKNEWWSANGVEVVRQRLPVGDYVLMNDKIKDVFARKEKRGIPVKMMDLLGTYDIAVDSKNSVQELVSDICGKQHDRFRDECLRAQRCGIQLIVLVEELLPGGRLDNWRSPIGWDGLPMHKFRPDVLRKVMLTMQEEYGVRFRFCHPNGTGRALIEYLEGRRK